MGNEYTIDTADVAAGRTWEYRARLQSDPYADVESPRDDEGNAAHLVLSVDRYDLPHEDDTDRLDEAFERGGLALAARYLTVCHDAVVVPVWGYSHGGLTLSAGTRSGAYADMWDSGLAGLAYVRRDWARENLGEPAEHETLDDMIVRVIGGEVDRYDAWANGDVFGAIAERRPVLDEDSDDDRGEDDEWEEIDAVWGFIGDDREYALGEAVDMCEQQRDEDDSDEIEIDDMRDAETGIRA